MLTADKMDPPKTVYYLYECERCAFAGDYDRLKSHIFRQHHKSFQIKPKKLKFNKPQCLYSCPDPNCPWIYQSLSPNSVHSDHMKFKDLNPRSDKPQDLPIDPIPNFNPQLSAGPPQNLDSITVPIPTTSTINSPIPPPPIHPPPPTITTPNPSPPPPPPIHPIAFGFVPQAAQLSAPLQTPK